MLILLWSCLPIISGITYIDNALVEPNLAYTNMSIAYTHNERGSSVSNLTFQSKVTILKILLYVKVRIAEDQSDSMYKREFFRTVIDLEKLFKGSQVNFLVKAYIDNIKKFMDFKVKFPMKPVSLVVNFRLFKIGVKMLTYLMGNGCFK